MMRLRMKALVATILLLTGSLMAMAEDINIEVGGINYSVDESTMTASVEKTLFVSGDIVLPPSVTHNGKTYALTSIGEGAFEFCFDLTSVSIPYGVKTIGEYAFDDCSKITSVNIPSSVISIGQRAFCLCESLTSIIIPASVTSLGINPFEGCKKLNTIQVEEGNKVYDSRDNCNAIIETATNKLISGCGSSIIPYGVTVIGENAFGWLDITTIDIPASVTTIGVKAFKECVKLTSVKIPASVTFIDDFAFDMCNSLKDVYFYGTEGKELKGYSFHLIGDDAVLHVDASLVGWYMGNYTLGDAFAWVEILQDAGGTIGVEVDGVNYYLNEATMTAAVGYTEDASGDIVLPPSVTHNGKTYALTSIGNHAFFETKNLTSITLPSGVKTIEEGAFKNCSSLTAIELPNTVDSIANRAFEDCEKLASVNIPNGVKTISEKTFSSCFSLASIEIPSSVTFIGEDAFSFNALTSIEIPGSVVSIGKNAFYSCGELTSLTLNEGLKTIGESAFESCGSLKSLSIPASVESIGAEFIAQCNALKSIKVEEGNKVYDSRNNCNAVVETATHTLIAGCNASSIPYGIEGIGYRAFSGCMEMTSIDIPASVTSMGINPFYNCENLNTIVVDKANKTFDSRENCNAIIETRTNKLISACSTTHIPYGVAAIGQEAFSNLEFTTIDIPATVNSIEKRAFSSCYDLTSVKIPEGVTTLAESVFTHCRSLTSAEIPSSVTRIDQHAFEFCDDLPSVTIPASVASIDDYAFRGCGSLKDVYLLGTEVKDCCRNSFCEISKDAVLHVEESLVHKYKSQNDGYWYLSFADIVPLEATGIEDIHADDNKQPYRIYSVDGKQQNAMQKGINILRYKNGKTIKVMRK